MKLHQFDDVSARRAAKRNSWAKVALNAWEGWKVERQKVLDLEALKNRAEREYAKVLNANKLAIENHLEYIAALELANKGATDASQYNAGQLSNLRDDIGRAKQLLERQTWPNRREEGDLPLESIETAVGRVLQLLEEAARRITPHQYHLRSKKEMLDNYHQTVKTRALGSYVDGLHDGREGRLS